MYGAQERRDGIVALGPEKYVLFYGFDKEDEGGRNHGFGKEHGGKEAGDDGAGYCWRRDYDHRPTAEELRRDVTELVNGLVDERILCGMTYKDMEVWLSTENQLNYKAAHDLAVQTEGKTLPVTFKFGTEEDPQYHTFETVEELEDFHVAMVKHIQAALAEGWAEKDNKDWHIFKT